MVSGDEMSGVAGTTRRELVTAAQQGDEAAFGALVEPYRRELHVHCYRMTASLDDADDMVQEVMLRAWRGLARFEGRSSFRTWLYRIATNVCLTAINHRTRRVLPTGLGQPGGGPGEGDGSAADPVWIEPYPDEMSGLGDGPAGPAATYEQRESVELAFLAAFQYIPANQRAALILREVLGFSAREVADALDTSTAAVNSALQHARHTVRARIPEQSQQATLRELGDDRLRAIVEAYSKALEQGDVDTIMSMLADDATWSMPPQPQWFQGHAAIAEFLVTYPMREEWQHLPTRANGQLAVGCYLKDRESGRYEAAVIDVLTLRGSHIAAVTAFIGRERFSRFGLPASLPDRRAAT
jgi:RNA polymerase sigma-70 factor, ECF subfamily